MSSKCVNVRADLTLEHVPVTMISALRYRYDYRDLNSRRIRLCRLQGLLCLVPGNARCSLEESLQL